MPQHQTTRVSLHVLSVGCALSIFLADLVLPVGVAVSLPYIAVVLLAARSSWRGSAALAALGLTAREVSVSRHQHGVMTQAQARYIAVHDPGALALRCR